MNKNTVTKFRELEMDKNTIYKSAALSVSEFIEVKSTTENLRVELEVKTQLDKDVSHSTSAIEVGGERRVDSQTVIDTEKAPLIIKIRISKSVYLTIKLESLKDGSSSVTSANKKYKSSTSVLEVGGGMKMWWGGMKMKMTHADTDSITKYSEVKSRVKKIKDDADRRTKIDP